MIIDFHTHIFPEKVVDKAIKILEDNIFKISHVVEKANLDGRLESLKASMQRYNITYSVVMPIATNPSQTVSINTFAQQINGKDNIISFGSVHPHDDECLLHLEKIKEMGLKGIKLHPEYQNFYIDSPESLKVLKKAGELGLYVMLHAGEDKGIEPPVHCMPKNLRNALNYVSGENIIAAHMGGYNVWEDVIKYLSDTPIYFDTSYSVGVMSEDIAREVIQKHSPDKILFATDSPWQNQGYVVESLKKLNLGEDAERKIFYENGAKILGL